MNRFARRALHTCRIPDDLEAATFRDSAGENPAAVGVSQETVEAIWASVQGLYRTGVHPGIQLSIRHRGEQILHRALGHASGNGPLDPPDAARVPMTTDTPVCYFSAPSTGCRLFGHLAKPSGLRHLHGHCTAQSLCSFLPALSTIEQLFNGRTQY